MIKANDLRVGNIVQDAISLEKWLVVSKLEQGVITCGDEDFNYPYLEESLQPVPLTRDVLRQLGFGDTSIPNPFFNIWDKHFSRGRHISVHNPGSPNEMVFVSEKGDRGILSSIVVRNFDYDEKTYVHQLQNLYFALTGEELNIEL